MGIFGNKRVKVLEDFANAPVGSSVEVDGRRGHIQGTVLFDEDGDTWVEHLIVGADGKRFWVSVENFDETLATLWETVPPLGVNGGPGDRSVSFRGHSYKRSEDGTARFRTGGSVDLPDHGSIDYVDFTGPDGQRVSFERFGDKGTGRRTVSAGSCPNCGAPLVLDQLNRCSHCGSTPTVDHGEWSGWEVAAGRDVSKSTRAT